MPKRKRVSAYGSGRPGYGKRRLVSAATRPSRGTRAITVVPRTFGNARVVTERKYFDSSFSGNITEAVTFAGCEADPATLNTLFVPSEGNDINNRVGRKVNVLAIKVKGSIRTPPNAAADMSNNESRIRLILYQDMQTNAAQAQAEEVISSDGITYNMFQNTANFGRFRVLKDKRIQLTNPNISQTGTANANTRAPLDRTFKFTIKFRKPVLVRFNGTNGGTIADIVDNSFHMIANTTSDDYAPALQYTCRTTYVDF